MPACCLKLRHPSSYSATDTDRERSFDDDNDDNGGAGNRLKRISFTR